MKELKNKLNELRQLINNSISNINGVDQTEKIKGLMVNLIGGIYDGPNEQQLKGYFIEQIKSVESPLVKFNHDLINQEEDEVKKQKLQNFSWIAISYTQSRLKQLCDSLDSYLDTPKNNSMGFK